MNLILKRAGAFHAQWESLDGVCGTAGDSTRNYTYECVIVADAAVLDANGFIIDQLDVDAYFQNQYSGFKSDSSKPTTNYNGYNTKYASKPILYKPLSCERIAIGAVNDILKLVKNHGCKVSRLSVPIALASSPVASMTCEWAEEKLEGTPAKELDSREQFVQTKSVRVLVSRLEDTSLTELNARIGIMLGEVLHKDGKVVAVTQYSHGSDFHGVVYWTNNWAGK